MDAQHVIRLDVWIVAKHDSVNDTNVYYFSTIVDYRDYDLHSGSAYMQILCHMRGRMPIVPLHF
jgi:hypothetical protein